MTETKQEEQAKTIVVEKKAGFFFDNLSFLLKARSEDSTRVALHRLHVEREGDKDAVGICTDGKRMHIWNDFPSGWIAPGNYRVNQANTKMIVLQEVTYTIEFPNWKKIMPDKENKQSFPFDLEGKSIKKTEIVSFGKVVAKFTLESKCAVNLSFLNDLSGHEWTVYYDEPDKAVLFLSETLTAVIMPMATT